MGSRTRKPASHVDSPSKGIDPHKYSEGSAAVEGGLRRPNRDSIQEGESRPGRAVGSKSAISNPKSAAWSSGVDVKAQNCVDFNRLIATECRTKFPRRQRGQDLAGHLGRAGLKHLRAMQLSGTVEDASYHQA